MSIPTINLWEGRVYEGDSDFFSSPHSYTVAVCGHVLDTDEVMELVKALLSYLTDADALAIHEKLGEDCDLCPCHERGVQRGYDTPRQPLGV